MSEDFRSDPRGATMRRSRQTELYIMGWLVIELILLIAEASGLGWATWIPRLLVIVRILDIFQSSVNLSVFDQLRTSEHIVVSSAVRTLVLSFMNYLELLVCFGILYTSMIGDLLGAYNWRDALYYSVVTQLTIGYGDIRPVGWARLVSAAQGLIAVAFTILIFGRIVSVLPRLESVISHDVE